MFQASIQEDSSATIDYCVRKSYTTYLVPSDVEEITVEVYDTSTGSRVGDAFTVDPDIYVYSSLQPWDADDTGYNVRVVVPRAYLATGNRTYRVQVLVTPSNGGEPQFLEHVELTTGETYETA